MSEISNAEATLMGLLSEQPMHPYQIEKQVEWRDMRYWTELSISSIYKLLVKLEKQGCVAVDRQVTEGNRVRKVYRMTDAGRRALAAKLCTLVSKPEHLRWQVDIALSNLNLLPKKRALKCLERYGKELDALADGYRRLQGFLREQDCPTYRMAIARRPVYLLEAERRWLEDYLREIEES